MHPWNVAQKSQYSQLTKLQQNISMKIQQLITIEEKDRIESGTYAKYEDEFEIECNNMEPQVSGPDNVDKVPFLLVSWKMWKSIKHL